MTKLHLFYKIRTTCGPAKQDFPAVIKERAPIMLPDSALQSFAKRTDVLYISLFLTGFTLGVLSALKVFAPEKQEESWDPQHFPVMYHKTRAQPISVIVFWLSVIRLRLTSFSVSQYLFELINRILANRNPKTENREPITGNAVANTTRYKKLKPTIFTT